jgi:RNA polymerase sigma-70 factor (ECF subfamily)
MSPANLDRSSMELDPELIDPEPTPAAAATMKEVSRRVTASMQMLEDVDRDVITLRHFEHLTNGEVAERLGVSEPAASMRYLRAVRRLRALLQDPDPEEN